MENWNTDENGWPYLVAIVGIVIAVGSAALFLGQMQVIEVGFVSILFFSSLALTLCFVFSEKMKPIPLYKKLICGILPFLILSKKVQHWMLKHLKEKSNGGNS